MRERRRQLACVATTLAVAAAVIAPGGAGAVSPTGMVCKAGGPSYRLVAEQGDTLTPDGNSIHMWSYGTPNHGFQSPGPVLCVDQGDTVTIRLHNSLPESTSVVFPGQEAVHATGGSPGLFTREAPAGGDARYTFTASEPGTYLYESGTDPSKQVEMGLYGALVVRPAGHPDWAYDSPATQFDPEREYILLFSEIDPDLHRAVERSKPYDVTKLHNRYFTVNGREFPDTIQDNGVSWLPDQPYGALVRVQPQDPSNPDPALVRMLNAGLLNHPFHPHGNHARMIAQDGRLRLTPGGGDASTEHFGETIPSGATEDYLFKWNPQDDFSPDSPLPVTIPDYRDLAFKDGDTYYSGNPYLGYKGTLPSGTTSQNICGEWYFPWHSHALNEFTNFDEGFGGMATLLRVDPLGGCTATPTATKINAGTLRGGTFADLAVDDAANYEVDSTTAAPTTRWRATFSDIPAGLENLRVTYKGGNSVDCTQRLSIFKWSTNQWLGLDSRTVGPTQELIEDLAPSGAPSSYVGTNADAGKLRLRVACKGPATPFYSSANLMTLTYDAP